MIDKCLLLCSQRSILEVITRMSIIVHRKTTSCTSPIGLVFLPCGVVKSLHLNPLAAMSIIIYNFMLRRCDVISLNSICWEREGEGAGGVNHRKVTAANGGRLQTF